ncbi:MAG: hypothetical protein Q7S31_03445 [bacterium]|nr:hypothetical protein [bacterium]
MTIKEEVRYTGAEAARVLCDDPECHTPLGAVILYGYDNGYGEKAIPPTRKQRRNTERLAKAHERKHQGKHTIRVIVFHKLKEQQVSL